MMTQKAEPEMRTRVRVKGRTTTGHWQYDLRGLPAFRSRPVDGKSDTHLHTPTITLSMPPTIRSRKRWKAAQLGDLKAKAPDLELDFDARFAKKLLASGICSGDGKDRRADRRACRNRSSTNSRSSSKRIEKGGGGAGRYATESANTRSRRSSGKAKRPIFPPTS